MKRIFLIVLTVLLIAFPSVSFAAQGMYGATSLIGSATNSVDSIPEALLEDGSACIAWVSDDAVYFYIFDATSVAAESSPGVIAPDDSDGTGRWIQVDPNGMGEGSGDVTGPEGAVAGNLPIFDATGKILSDSGKAPSDFLESESDPGVTTHESSYNHELIATAVQTETDPDFATWLSTFTDDTGTDDQTIDTLSLGGTTLSISLEGDGEEPQTVDLAGLQDGYEANTDAQDLTLTGDTLAISNDPNTDVDLSPYKDNTDDQNATEVSVSTTNFDGIFANDSTSDTVQEALDLADDHNHSGVYLESETDPTVDSSAEIQAIIGASVYEPADATILKDADIGVNVQAYSANMDVDSTDDATAGGAFHDGFSDFVANEHIDWTTSQAPTVIHADNYTDQYEANTDAQDLTLTTNTLAISGDPNTDVDLSPYLDNTATNITVAEAPTNVEIQSSDGTNDTIAAADGTNAGVMTTTMYDEHVANNAKVSYDINSQTGKTTPVDADELGLYDSVAAGLKKLTWANLKATLETYFDTQYAPKTGSKSFCILDPVATDDYPVWRAPYALTITDISVQCLGGTNIVGQLTECDGEGINAAVVDSSDITAAANNSVDDDGTLSNPSIDSGDYVGWKTESISGTPTSVTVTFDYTY